MDAVDELFESEQDGDLFAIELVAGGWGCYPQINSTALRAKRFSEFDDLISTLSAFYFRSRRNCQFSLAQ
jgi:hypothetical protein